MSNFVKSLKYSSFYEYIFPFMQLIQLLNWLLGCKQPPTPHLIKQIVIKNYAEKYRIEILIETGTYLGTMVNATRNTFKKIYTIELNKQLYFRAKRRFKKYNHVNVFLGDSSKILPVVLKKINQPCIFWLDAHYSRGITTKGTTETPIIDELRAILNHQIKSHVILIDDVSEFNGFRDYPPLNELKKIIINLSKNVVIKIKYNMIILTPKKNLGPKEDK